MNIGVDVDGVLVDLESYQLRYSIPFFRKKYGLQAVNRYGYDIQDIFLCSRSQRKQFWQRYIWRYCLFEAPRPKAAEVLITLKESGHKITIITSRVYAAEQTFLGWLFRKMLIHWLAKNQIPYDEIVFCSEKESADEKATVCREKNIHVMLEDKADNMEAILPLANVLCFNAGYNANCTCRNLVRVDNFEQVCAYIQEKAADKT